MPGDPQLIAVTANTLRNSRIPDRPEDAVSLADQLMDRLVAADPEPCGRIACPLSLSTTLQPTGL